MIMTTLSSLLVSGAIIPTSSGASSCSKVGIMTTRFSVVDEMIKVQIKYVQDSSDLLRNGSCVRGSVPGGSATVSLPLAI